MRLFFIGDIHGCYHTFLKLLESWLPEKEMLVQVGDLIDRGNYSPEVTLLAQKLETQNPNKVIFLRGNHEQMMIDFLDNKPSGNSWMYNGGSQTLKQFNERKKDLEATLAWIKDRPLIWENEHILASHAGFSDTPNPLDVHHKEGILWNRSPLKNMGKTQVIGHTPLQEGKARYTGASNSWNIDTGAYRGFCLTGIKLNEKGQFLEEFNIPTLAQDYLL
ncbi:metallophosphoesterase family protein [Echinicola shivajiensis]|uniref:metallophosphoesterase family protein n=1 Tax=Echinicola shivajiensis TaxID=1035916 RepID=UPI001BFCA10C|nr:metallophosphoesterase family protein [Echinicola shivajiensis]